MEDNQVATTIRCDAIILKLVVTEYDEHGRPVAEMETPPAKVFRLKARDFWADVDQAVEALKQQQRAGAPPAPPSPAPPAIVKGRRRP